MRWLAKYRRISRADRWLTLEAAVSLVCAAVMLKLLPFRWVARGAGELSGQTQRGEVSSLPPLHPALPGQVGRAVVRAARHLPLTLLCLPQAIAAQRMLRRRGIASTLHFGMALSTDGSRRMLAHAWLTVGEQGVIGIPASQGFSELARFSQEASGAPPAQ